MKLLIIEDSEDDAVIMLEMLRQSGTDTSTVRVSSIQEAIAKLRSSTFDVVTLDLGLPDSQSTDAIPRLLAQARDTPIVVVSGTFGAQTILAAIRAGARDYLVKGKFDAPRLMQVLSAVAAWGAHFKELKDEIREPRPVSG